VEAKNGVEKGVCSGILFRDEAMPTLCSQVVPFDLPTESVADGRVAPRKYASWAYSCSEFADTREFHLDGLHKRVMWLTGSYKKGCRKSLLIRESC
jgi:hypothetical protein